MKRFLAVFLCSVCVALGQGEKKDVIGSNVKPVASLRKFDIAVIGFVPTNNFALIDTTTLSRFMSGRGDFWSAYVLPKDTVLVLKHLILEHATADSLPTSYEVELYDLTESTSLEYTQRGKPENLFKIQARGGKFFHPDTATNLLGSKSFRWTVPEKFGIVLRNQKLAQANSANAFARSLSLLFADNVRKKQ